MPHWLRASIAAVITLASVSAHAADESVHALRHDTRVDVAVTVTSGAWLVMSELMKSSLVPEKCRWCYRGDDGADLLNPYDGWLRRQLLWSRPRTADVASSVILGLLEPTTQLGLDAFAANQHEALRQFPLDALLTTEATVVAALINQITKYGFARERPFVHFLPRAPNALRQLTDSPADDNLSFFSGHTTLAFALATSSATIATLRGYRLAPVLWGTGLVAATSVGYLRIAADKHYFSDVMTGAVVGSVVGIGLPLLFHTRETEMPGSSAAALSSPAVRPSISISGAF
jgi:membrane-associated phospholipid phosphatase